MNPAILEALATAGAAGFDTEAFQKDVHVREETGVWIVSPDRDAVDSVRVNVNATKDIVILLGAGVKIAGFSLQGVGHLITVGAGARVGGVTVYGERNLVSIGDGSVLQMSNIIRGIENRLEIGANCVGIGGTIRTSDDHTIFDVESGTPINRARNVRIGDQVYLGRNVRVSKGADVGDGVVVAPDSVVTGKLQPGGYYGGVPARLIKANVTWKARA